MKEEWLLCPICNDKTRLKVRLATVLENFPLFCPKCKKEMATWCFSNNSFSIVEQGKKYISLAVYSIYTK